MNKHEQLANDILENIGGEANIKTVVHCMTRLRFTLNDLDKADQTTLKSLEGVVGVVYKGGQFQIIIGPEVSNVYSYLSDYDNKQHIEKPKEKKTAKGMINSVLDALSACMTPLIPVLLCAGFSKTIVSILGPQLLGIISETSSTYILFSFVGDAGFYFMPIFAAYTAAKKFGVSPILAMFLGAIMIHPSLLKLVSDGGSLSVYGIPANLQNYTGTLIPIILSVWVMSFVESFIKKYTPSALKIFAVPFGTLLIMLPLALTILGPLGAYVGNYVGAGIIGLYDIAGPLALGVLGAVFLLLVATGMHTVIFAFLFVSFPAIGYDAFVLPAMIASSWAGAGVTLACIYKFKKQENKALTLGYFFTWLLGGVGEPLLYGLNIPYKTPLYAGMIAGFIAGLIAGFTGLTAYVLNISNGIYGLASFFGGPNSNYTALIITLVLSTIVGFVVVLFFPLKETETKEIH